MVWYSLHSPACTLTYTSILRDRTYEELRSEFTCIEVKCYNLHIMATGDLHMNVRRLIDALHSIDYQEPITAHRYIFCKQKVLLACTIMLIRLFWIFLQFASRRSEDIVENIAPCVVRIFSAHFIVFGGKRILFVCERWYVVHFRCIAPCHTAFEHTSKTNGKSVLDG